MDAEASDSDGGYRWPEAIHRAARAGDLEGLRRALETGVNPDRMCDTGRPLTMLCDSELEYEGPEENYARCARMLIEAGANVNVDSRGRSPLKNAAARGNLKVLQTLLEAGADVHETSEFGWTVLHASVGSNSSPSWFKGPQGTRRLRSAVDCTSALLAAGADANAMAHGDTSPLMVVGCAGNDLSSPWSTRLYAVLLSGGATLDGHVLEDIKEEYNTESPYLERVHDAGGWKRYAQSHRKQLVSLFAPKLRLPADVIPLVVDFWANVGMY